MLWTWWWLKERVTGGQILGLAIALSGALLLILIREGPPSRFGSTWGNLMLLAAAFAWAAYFVLGKREALLGSPLRITFYAMGIGWLFNVPLFLAQSGWSDFANMSHEGWLATVFLGVASTGIAYALYPYALRGAEVAVVAGMQYFEPLIPIVLAVALLSEPILPLSFVGGVLIVVGVIVVDRTAGVRQGIR